MSRRDDDLGEHLAVLVRLNRRGGDVYARALHAARFAVAKVVLQEAERLAAASQRRIANVIPFRSLRRESPDQTPKNGGVDP